MKKLNIRQLLNRVADHHNLETLLTPEVAEGLGSFIQAQAEPHGILDTVNGVLTAYVTGIDSGATFPVSADGHTNDMDALVAACTWLALNGALTYEWMAERSTTDVGSLPDDARGPHDQLDRHDALWRVVKCMQAAIRELSDNTFIYADDPEGHHISHEEVGVIIKHLTLGNEWSAIQYSDAMDMGVDS